MSLEHSPARQRLRRRFGRIRDAVAYGGISRSNLYVWASRHPGLMVKSGVTTLVNFDLYDELLDALPLADIRPPAPRKSSNS
jgi:hypothetical protein